MGQDAVPKKSFGELEDDSDDDAQGSDEEPALSPATALPPAPLRKKSKKVKTPVKEVDSDDETVGSDDEPVVPPVNKEKGKAPSKKSKAPAPAKIFKRNEPVSNGIARDPRCKMCERGNHECWERTGTGFSCVNCCKWKMRCESQSDDDSYAPSEDEEKVPEKSSGKKRSAPVPDDEPASKKAKKSGVGLVPKKKEGKKSKPPAPTQRSKPPAPTQSKPPAPTQPSKPPAPTQSKKKKVVKTAANVPTSDEETPVSSGPSKSQPAAPSAPSGPSKPQPAAPMRQELPAPDWMKNVLIEYFSQSLFFFLNTII